MDFGDNVWDVEFDPPDEWSEANPPEKAESPNPVRGNGCVSSAQRFPRQSGSSIPVRYQAPYHFHHGGEELLIVLRGTPTLRSPDGERELKEG